MTVVIVSEPPEPPPGTGLTASPKRVKAVNSHRHGLEPFFDVVPDVVVEMTAQFVTREGSQIAGSVDEKLRVGDIVFLGKSVEKRRPQNTSCSDGLHESRALVNAAGSVPRRL